MESGDLHVGLTRDARTLYVATDGSAVGDQHWLQIARSPVRIDQTFLAACRTRVDFASYSGHGKRAGQEKNGIERDAGEEGLVRTCGYPFIPPSLPSF